MRNGRDLELLNLLICSLTIGEKHSGEGFEILLEMLEVRMKIAGFY